ncbi:MAG: 6,7-dimethyl-8-ribityllumazine synthase [Actinomycetota bacterium]|jgi:6,7-dimethyl-8-ribityllumazine synthase|nr:6,7-dimethyl-8-ribityllumazine synthase [Actinomycetota bacterium]
MGVYSLGDQELDAHGIRFGLVVARYNLDVTKKLLDGAERVLRDHGVTDEHMTVVWVPGAFEVPLVARRLALGRHVDAVICLGAVVRGDTPHFEYVAGECAAGIMRVSLEVDMPVIFGVLTTDNLEQAQARVGGAEGHKGEHAARSAIEMVALLRQLR